MILSSLQQVAVSVLCDKWASGEDTITEQLDILQFQVQHYNCRTEKISLDTSRFGSNKEIAIKANTHTTRMRMYAAK